MATKRRRPGALPPSLTPKQRADAHRCFPIGMHVALYYATRNPPGLKKDDLIGAADEAVTLAVCTYDNEPRKVDLEGYVWARVHSTLKNLIKQTAVRLGLRAPNDTQESGMARGGGEALKEFAETVTDPSNFWKDTREQQTEHYDDVAHHAATAQVTGAGGHVWHMRGEVGFVLRAEYVRVNKALHDEVAGLPPAIATIVELRWFQEKSLEQVAAEAGVSEATVSRKLAEALPLLRARLEARGFRDLSMLEGR